MSKIVITDYGVGNLLSILRAFEHCCDDVMLEKNPAAIKDATHLVVPGVGAFASCVQAMKDHGFEQPIRDHIEAGKPMLGVCVGMQMLFDDSDEFGTHAGLGVIPGHVTRLPEQGRTGSHKIPNIGWEKLI
ncbi:MAG TPA: imidazole glycerol phosphate synthase subunit HisH, partial [Alphaproteobacteria bacterium]